MKNLIITFFIIFFICFTCFQFEKNNTHKVLKIIKPNEIIIDFNNNFEEDKNEKFIFSNLITFSTKHNNDDILEEFNISNENAMKMGYLCEDFSKKLIEGKNIKLKNNKVYIEEKDYEQLLVNNGFATYKDKPVEKLFKENIEKARKLNLVILNNKNHKYHKLNCKFGLIAHNSQVIPTSKLSSDARPCKYCHAKRNETLRVDTNTNKIETKSKKKLSLPPLTFTQNNIKFFITNFNTSKPDNKCQTQLCQKLKEEINSAKVSIDFAIYGYSKIPTLESAMKNAQNRGVKIRFVYDLSYNKNIYPDTLYLSKIFTSNQNDNVPAIMHNKFFIFDNKKIYTGSANISSTDMSGFNSNATVIIESPKLAQIYTNEFEQMYKGLYHQQKNKLKQEKIYFENFEITALFSPKDKIITQNIIPLINNAKSYIYIPAFLITHSKLSEALINAHKRGIDVKIILDATNIHKKSSSKISNLRAAKIPVKTEIFAGKLHSKSILIDDIYTIIGSMNFSKSAEDINDENILIIKNPNITKFYKNYFNYLRQEIPDKWLYFYARSESPNSIGSCQDGIDNDFDGKIDMDDDSCKAK